MFKVLHSFVYCITENYACDDYLCSKEAKLHVANKGFENTTYNNISGIGIPERLLKKIHVMDFQITRSHISSCLVV